MSPAAPESTATPASASRGGQVPPARPGRRVPRWAVAAAAVAVVVGALASLFIGAADLTPADLLAADGLEDPAVELLLVSRLPRLVAVLLAGTALSVAGLVMMHLTRNRFVSPSTAGTVEWAQLGILIATLLLGSTSLVGKMSVAVVTALIGTFVFLRILRRLTLVDVLLVPLLGLMLGAVVSGVTTFLAYRYDLLQSLDAWMAGDFSGVLRGRYEMLWLVLAATVVAYVQADRFTIAGLGEGFAVNLGLDYHRVLVVGLAVVAIITAVVVVVVGAIPFLGLVVPNLVTLALGDDLRRALPVTAVSGAAFVLVCDVIGRVIRYPYEIPVGTVVGVVGGALFVAILLRARTRGAQG